MAFTSVNFNRPLSVTTAAEAAVIAGGIREVDSSDTLYVDINTTVASAAKLIMRIEIPTQFSGYKWRAGAKFLIYPGSAANFTASPVAPALNTATNYETAQTYWSDYVDLDAFYTAAGDARD